MAHVNKYATFVKQPKRTFESVNKRRIPRILRVFAGDQFSLCFDEQNVYATGERILRNECFKKMFRSERLWAAGRANGGAWCV